MSWIKERRRPNGKEIDNPRAYLRRVDANGDRPALIAAMEADLAGPRSAPADPLPEWCRRCGDLDAGDGNPAIRNGRFRTHNGLPSGTPCPDCHPTAKGATA